MRNMCHAWPAFWYWQSLRLCWLKPSRSHHQCCPHCRHLILCLGWAVVGWWESCALAHVFGKSMADRVSLNAWSFNAPSAQSHYFALLPQLAAPAAPLASWRMSSILGWCVFGGSTSFSTPASSVVAVYRFALPPVNFLQRLARRQGPKSIGN